VAFHARNLQSQTPHVNTPLVFSNVHLNEGGFLYSSTTGYFTVSVPGLYVFISSTGPYDHNSGAYFSLYVDDTSIDWGYAYSQAGNELSSVHGVVHLQAGQRVWVRSNGNTYSSGYSAFTGFLLSPDF
jgi:hypothetical protein